MSDLKMRFDSDSSLNQKIIDGVNVLADNVASTLGPKGRNVILQEKGKSPIITKDGVTVAQFVHLDDPFMNAGVQIIKQAATQTNNIAGDGTTTSTVLARAILTQAQKYLTAGASPIELKRGIDKASEAVIDNLKELATPITSEEDIAHVATISANNDKSIGSLIAMAVDRVGKDGAITIEEARSSETSLDITEGFIFDSGYRATAFITDERRGIMRYDEPLIMVTDHTISTVEQILPILEVIAREGRPFVLVAEEIENQALAAMIMNAMRGTLKVAAIKAPRYGEERRNILQDLAIAVNATFVSRESGMKAHETKLEDLGSAKVIECTKTSTTVVGGNADYELVDQRIETLKDQLKSTESMHDCERIQERVTRLASGIAVIRVGAPTEIEMVEKKHRIEDALEAVRSAQIEGIVPGGGVALIRAGKELTIDADNDDQAMGASIVQHAVRSPLRQMALNAGLSPDLIESLVESLGDTEGYCFYNSEQCDMFEAGIVDPVKVTGTALSNAVSVAGTLITTNHAIIGV